MTQFDQQLLATLYLMKGATARETRLAAKAIMRVATIFVLVAGSGLLVIATQDRLADHEATVAATPSPDYLRALAAADDEVPTDNREASAR